MLSKLSIRFVLNNIRISVLKGLVGLKYPVPDQRTSLEASKQDTKTLKQRKTLIALIVNKPYHHGKGLDGTARTTKISVENCVTVKLRKLQWDLITTPTNNL